MIMEIFYLVFFNTNCKEPMLPTLVFTLSVEALAPIRPRIFDSSNHKGAKHLQKYVSLGFYLDNVWKLFYWFCILFVFYFNLYFSQSSSNSRSYIWHSHFVECFLPYLHIKDSEKMALLKKRHDESSSLISLALRFNDIHWNHCHSSYSRRNN
jgi:hypothetical protein